MTSRRASRAVWVAAFLAVAAAGVAAQTPPDPRPLPVWGPAGMVYAVARSGNQLIVGGRFDYVGPPTGSFGVVDAASGEFVSASGVPFENITRVISDGQGGWYRVINSTVQHALPDGRVDPAFRFNPGLHPLGLVDALALHGHRLFIGGQFNAIDGQARLGLAALDRTTGALLPYAPPFDPNVASRVTHLAVSGDSLVIGGTFRRVFSGADDEHVAVIDLARDTLTAFSAPDVTDVTGLAVMDTRVYVGGSCLGATPAVRVAACALDLASGARVPWHTDVQTSFYPGVRVAAARGVVVLAGRQFIKGVDGLTAAVRWQLVPDDAVVDLATSGGDVYAAGDFHHVEAVEARSIVRLDIATGTIRPWTHAGPGVRTLAVGGNRVAMGGLLLNSVGGVARESLAVIDLTTGRPTDVVPRGVDAGDVRALAVLGPNVAVAGATAFRSFNLQTGQIHFWNPLTEGDVWSLATDGSRLFMAGAGTFLGRSFNGLAALDPGTMTVTPAAASPIDCCIDGLTESSGAVYAHGTFTAVPGYGRAGFAAYDDATLALLPWSPPGADTVRELSAVAFWRDRVLVVGRRAFWTDRNGGAALDLPVELPSFSTAVAIGRAGDAIIAAGVTPLEGLVARAIDAPSGRALPWGVTLGSPFNCCAEVVQGYSDLVVIGGSFSSANGTVVNGIAVFRLPAPPPPTRMRAAVSASTVSLSWQPGPGTPSMSYELEAGTTAGGTDLGTFPLAGPSVTATVAPGTYHVRVRARGVPGVSGPSSEVMLTVPPRETAPGAPGTLGASVGSGVVTLSWGAAAGNATTYVIEAGTAPGLADIGALPTGHLDTTFSTPAPSGTYYVRVRAANAFGASLPTNEVVVVVP